ncbi:MAG: hypothetical protein WBG57_04525, partial [Ornithinimicrobium sp.]
MSIREPGAYPWPTPLRDGTIGPEGWVEGPWDAELRVGRVPVLAVGSNASPGVLGDKLNALVGAGRPLVHVEVCRVTHLSVGHSAHLSRTGFVAAAPFRSGDDAAYSLAWLTPEQVDALDATEPNYDRLPLPEDCQAHAERTGEVMAAATLYVSQHGVLGQRGKPVPLMTQPQVLAWLRERLTSVDGISDAQL